MELTDENLQRLSECLQQTLSPDAGVRKPAEKFLESVEGNQNYPLLLLNLLDKAEVAQPIRVSASITFKNYVKRNWRVIEDEPSKVHGQDRATVKQLIVGLMLKSPEQVQNQLSDAISIIGREDFPDNWPNLLSEMTSKFETGDFHVINGVLRTAHSIFKRYRHEFKSQELWTEIKFVLDNFAAPFTNLFNSTVELAKTHASDPNALKVIFSSIVLECKIFYSLNFQDLPEHFEDNMQIWMSHFLQLLSVDNKLLRTDDEEEAGLLEQVKSQICDNVALYAQKYDEEFSPHLPGFVTAIWNLLLTTGQEVKFDLGKGMPNGSYRQTAQTLIRQLLQELSDLGLHCLQKLVSNAIQFLASVAERPAYKSLFEDPSTLANICEKVIVPNIQFRGSDEELFEDNPEEYIRRDIEGSDVDTRRRAACDLVQALSKSFEEQVFNNFSKYVQGLLQEYSASPVEKWKSKDAAIYLVTSLAAKAQTQKHGITQTSELVNIIDFYNSQIVTDLQDQDVNSKPVIKADCIKYLMVFRNQLSKELLIASFPHLVRHLAAQSRVVHTYAAHCIERLLMVRTPQGPPAITYKDIEPCANSLIESLFGAMHQPGSTENEYIMKAIMRSMSMMQENLLPLVPVILKSLTEKLLLVAKNPSKPHFNHYLFETLCVTVRTTCKVNQEAVTQFEQQLFPPFTEILQQDVQEFIPYVFQILSLLIELHNDAIPETYMQLFPHLLVPLLWERPGNIPPLVRLHQAYIAKGAKQIQPEKLTGLLGIFQKLIASKVNDHEGFYLLNSIVNHMPTEVFSPYVNQVFILLFQRLQSSKTTKYIKSLLVFFSVYMLKYDAPSLIQLIDGIQAKMFGMVVEKLFVQDLQKVSGTAEKKICAAGVTKLLTEAPAMLETYGHLWPQLLQALIGLFELPEDDSLPPDEHFIEIEDTPGYQTAYSQLAFAGKKEQEMVSESVPQLKMGLAKQLEKLGASHPGKLMPMIKSGLEAGAQNFVEQYLTAAGVSLT